MSTWYCWNPECRWSGADDHTEFRMGFKACPDCHYPVWSEAATERVAIREFEGNMSWEEAERKTHDSE